MTRVELRDEILRLTMPRDQQDEARGLFGVARSMLASVVESGLNLPDAAEAIRGKGTAKVPIRSQSPVATVTLAEIYAAQGHVARALRMIEEVLTAEPDHEEALRVGRELKARTDSDKLRAEKPSTAAVPPEQGLGLAVPAQESSSKFDNPTVAPAPPGETSEYVPAGFVETTGEEIQSEKPPQVVERAETEPSSTLTPPAHLVIQRAGERTSFYWEWSPSVSDDDGKEPAIWVVAFSPSGTAPVRTERRLSLMTDLREKGTTSGVVATDLPLDGAIRAALGRHGPGEFEVVALGRSLQDFLDDPECQEAALRARRQLLETN
jgi:hypothetical protein